MQLIQISCIYTNVTNYPICKMLTMNSKKIQQVLFASLLSMSLFSAFYVNEEAKDLKTQGFDVSYFSSEDAESMLPDVQFVGHVIDKIKDVIFVLQ